MRWLASPRRTFYVTDRVTHLNNWNADVIKFDGQLGLKKLTMPLATAVILTVRNKPRQRIEAILRVAGKPMRPKAIWDALGPEEKKAVSQESIRQLLGVMRKTGAVCQTNPGSGYFLRASMPAEILGTFDRNELLKDHIKTSELHRLTRGTLPTDRLWAANALVKYEEDRRKAAKRNQNDPPTNTSE